MITKEYGLLHKESQTLVKVMARKDGSRTLVLEDRWNETVPFSTTRLDEIAAFFLRPDANYSGSLYYDDFDREDFTPVAVLERSTPFRSSAEIKEVVLPPVISMDVTITDRSTSMPEILHKRYIPKNIQPHSADTHFVLIDDNEENLSQDQFIFAERSHLVGKVVHISNAVEDWPVPERLWNAKNLKLAIVDFGQDTLANACELREIEVGYARKP